MQAWCDAVTLTWCGRAGIEPGTEQCGADADMGRTMGDRDFEIGGHAHRQRGQAMACGGGGEPGEMRAGRRVGGRNAHEAGDGAAQPRLAQGDEGIGLGGGNSGLLRFIPDIDLDQILRCPTLGLLRIGQGVEQFRPVQYLDHVGQAYGVSCFVSLQAADQMEAEARVRGAQSRHLGRGLLHAIFPEMGVAGVEQDLHVSGRVGFADRDQRRRRAVGAGGCGGDLALQGGVSVEEWAGHGY